MKDKPFIIENCEIGQFHTGEGDNRIGNEGCHTVQVKGTNAKIVIGESERVAKKFSLKRITNLMQKLWAYLWKLG